MATSSQRLEGPGNLLEILEKRFREHPARHRGVPWDTVKVLLDQKPDKLAVIQYMEASGGEPDVLQFGADGSFYAVDCSAESPAGRRSLCYDREARTGRKKFPPESSAQEHAEAMGIELLSESQYRHLQSLGEFDLKTSSWIATPDDVRGRGGALFCDRRFGRVFTYHNGADSYYAARGFRGALQL